MKILELFYLLKEKLPYQQNGELPFHENLKNEFAWYQENLKSLDKANYEDLFQKVEPDITLKKFRNMEKKLCDAIIEAIKEARNARYHLAYKKIRSLLGTRNTKLVKGGLSDMACNYFYRPFLANISEEFYRVRNLEESDNDFPNNMKHCAFERSRRLGNYRFSLPGFPCLYLGSSLEVCEREVPKDENKKYCQAKYILRQDITRPNMKKLLNVWVLNLVPPTDEPDEIDLFNFLLLYPFFLACLTKRKHQDGNFHAEYIIPQLLLQFVREERLLDGICYLSTHATKEDPLKDMINCVLPVKDVKTIGYDDEGLLKWFEIKEI